MPSSSTRAASGPRRVSAPNWRERMAERWLLPRRPHWLWLLALAALLFHFAVFYSFKAFKAGGAPQAAMAGMAAVFIDPQSPQSIALVEHSSLLDFEPLFLPTRWNAEPSRMSLFDGGRRTEPFEPYAAEISRQLETLPASPAPHLPAAPADALAIDNGGIFSTFGHAASEAVRLQPRAGVVEIEALEGARRRQMIILEAGQAQVPALSDLSYGTFLLQVDASGSATLPLLRRTTGADATDKAWAAYLQRNASGWNLAPGSYQITVGP